MPCRGGRVGVIHPSPVGPFVALFTARAAGVVITMMMSTYVNLESNQLSGKLWKALSLTLAS